MSLVMSLVFLESGQACYLKEKIGNKFIVNKVYEFESEHDGIVDFTSQDDVVVDRIFNHPPLEKIESSVKECLLKKGKITSDIEKLMSEKAKIEHELRQLKKSKIEQDKFILNKSELINAKSIALFPESKVMPLILNEKNSFKTIGVTIDFSVKDNGERSWGYKIYDVDDNRRYSDFLCKKYGILINPTQAQIDETILKRLQEFEFSEYELRNVPNKYLSELQVKAKTEWEKSCRDAQLEKLKAEVEKADSTLREFLKTFE